MGEHRFIGQASDMLQFALDSWRSGNHHFAVLHAGMGCELALKAVLHQRNPLLISERGDRAHRYYSIGLGGQPGVPPLTQARTIGLADAFKDAVVVMEGRMPVSLHEFGPVIEDRNGVAHYAYHDTSRTERSLAVAITVAEATRKELNVAQTDFWGPYETVFHDLAKVAALPAPTPAQASVEEAAEALANAEAREAAHAAIPIGSLIEQVTRFGSALRTKDQDAEIQKVATRTTVCTTLNTVTQRAQRAVETLLTSHNLLPLPELELSIADFADVDISYEERILPWRETRPQRIRQAVQVLAVKRLVASRVVDAFFANLRPRLPAAFDAGTFWYIWVRETPRHTTLAWIDCPACRTAVRAELQGQEEAEDCLCSSEDSCNHESGLRMVAHIMALRCPVCALELTNLDELQAAGIDLSIDLDD